MLNLTINQSLQKEFEKRDHLSNLFPGFIAAIRSVLPNVQKHWKLPGN